jgi:hypothetical protein
VQGRHGKGPHHRGHRHDGPDGEVEAAGEEGEHLANRDEDEVAGLADDIQEVPLGEKIFGEPGKDDESPDQEDREHPQPQEDLLRPMAETLPARFFPILALCRFRHNFRPLLVRKNAGEHSPG